MEPPKTELDDDHKEIHFSLSYIDSIHPASRLTEEITGVITHELVHCYQWNACGSCPGGLIEGIADWVRLNCNLSPPHWKRETAGGMYCLYIYLTRIFVPSLLCLDVAGCCSVADLGPSLRRITTAWDRGYEHTAYFLQYLENRFGEGTIRRLNEKLRLHEYNAKPFWTECLGRPVEQLYGDYCTAGEDACNSQK